MASVNGVAFAGMNPTSGFLPINNTGNFVDSPIENNIALDKIVSSKNIRQSVSLSTPSVFDIFTNVNQDNYYPTNNNGIVWGVDNIDPNFGFTNYVDCSIKAINNRFGLIGRSLDFRTYNECYGSPAPYDVQVSKFKIEPWNGITQTGGVSVIGGATGLQNTSYFNVSGDDTFLPYYKTDYSVARFDAAMGGVVFPKNTTASRNMMSAENGTVIYNSTTNKLQVYAGDKWWDLH